MAYFRLMSGKKFRLPPLSPLIGSGLINFIRLTAGRKIGSKFILKYILTFLIIIILTPLRWFEYWYLRKSSQIRVEKPVFILGHWRSGTTLLHNLLCQSPNAAYVTTYQTVFSNYLGSATLLKPFMKFLMPQHRPGDNVRLNVNYPQEEEFALCNHITESYYHFFYFPESVEEFFERSVKFTRGNQAKWERSYDSLLKQALFTMPGKSYAVIKNPVNTGRVQILRKKYPDARFIHIYRNPYVVFLSTKKFFTELMPTLWLKETGASVIEEIILQKYADFMEKFDAERDERIVDIRFEDFEKEPVRTLEEFYKNSGMEDFDAIRHHLEAYARDQRSHKKNKYSISRREVRLIQERWTKYLRRWNYELPDTIEISD
ncbi:MAG: sulfotransferase [Cyclobacteriaceae bacterium]